MISAGDSYEQSGKTATHEDAVLTVGMRKGAAGWTMIGWSWATGK